MVCVWLVGGFPVTGRATAAWRGFAEHGFSPINLLTYAPPPTIR